MKKWIKYARSLRRDLSVLAGISLFIVVGIELAGTLKWLSAESVSLHLALIVQKLLLSYISSFIFYFLVVHYKSEKEKESINPYIYDECSSITRKRGSIMMALKKEWHGTPTLREVRIALRALHIYEMKTQDSMFKNWLYGMKQLTLKHQSNILRLAPYINPELASLLIDIERCTLFESLDFVGKENFSAMKRWDYMAQDILDYIALCDKLDAYILKNKRSYIS
ncbi:hypothetical protein EON83_27125 [bacterium]|nr:MAG: hypothetical protein EON83_27125 [bacterium]